VKRALIAMLLLSLACGGEAELPTQVLGGQEIDGALLEAGREVYQRYCQRCHGERGDGHGPSSLGQWPPPRDFRTARFKFAGIVDRGLPADSELRRIIAGGLAGTAMRDWDLADEQLTAVVHYIKIFSPPGKGFRNPRLAVVTPQIPADPYAGREDMDRVLEEGARLYHSMFRCSSCHPAYVSTAQVERWGAMGRGGEPFEPAAKWSENFRMALLPPDFLRHPLRAVRATRDEQGHLSHNLDDLARTIYSGLQGPMPGYGHLGAEGVWAVAHYVKSLADLRETGEGLALQRKLREMP
jgi:mono/diheme cytochrome c family protein